MSTLKEFIEKHEKVVRQAFLVHGYFHPTMIGEDATGQAMMAVFPNCDREAIIFGIQQIVTLRGLTTYVYVSEAWVVAKGPEDIGPFTPSTHPDREEVIIFDGRSGKETMLAQIKIIRAEGLMPDLGPIEWMGPTTMSSFTGQGPQEQ